MPWKPTARRPGYIGHDQQCQEDQRQAPCLHAIPDRVGRYRRHDPREGRARVGPFLQQRKPGRQQDDRGSRLGESKNYPEVLRVAGSGESGNHLLTAGQIGTAHPEAPRQQSRCCSSRRSSETWSWFLDRGRVNFNSAGALTRRREAAGRGQAIELRARSRRHFNQSSTHPPLPLARQRPRRRVSAPAPYNSRSASSRKASGTERRASSATEA